MRSSIAKGLMTTSVSRHPLTAKLALLCGVIALPGAGNEAPMSYSVDVNVLLYASNESSPLHEPARTFLAERVSDPDVFCIAWITLMGYLRIATHPSIFPRPLAPREALQNVAALLALPRVRALAEGDRFLETYQEVSRDGVIRGNLVPDAHLAALLRQHGVRLLYTTDADFKRFSSIEVRNPFAG